VNVKGVLFTVQPAISLMKDGGWIQEVRGTGIRINVLSPGAVDTPSLRTALADASGADQVDALVTKMGEGNPLGRLAQPRELGTRPCSSPAKPRASSPVSSCSPTAGWLKPADSKAAPLIHRSHS
jgi:NAD(P)-dependent dehydrogenase (short-subunit alcohol dehydrogenase family)